MRNRYLPGHSAALGGGFYVSSDRLFTLPIDEKKTVYRADGRVRQAASIGPRSEENARPAWMNPKGRAVLKKCILYLILSRGFPGMLHRPPKQRRRRAM